jgi:hypothetical protein
MKTSQRRMMTMIIQAPAGVAAVEVDASPEDGALVSGLI